MNIFDEVENNCEYKVSNDCFNRKFNLFNLNFKKSLN